MMKGMLLFLYISKLCENKTSVRKNNSTISYFVNVLGSDVKTTHRGMEVSFWRPTSQTSVISILIWCRGRVVEFDNIIISVPAQFPIYFVFSYRLIINCSNKR